jgi:hypothetical protein
MKVANLPIIIGSFKPKFPIKQEYFLAKILISNEKVSLIYNVYSVLL